MIWGDIGSREATEWSAFHPVLRAALDRLRQTDLQALDPGKYEWDGERMFLLIQEPQTAPKAERKPEAHRRYADIQLLIEGREWIGCARRTDRSAVVEDELETKDYALYEDPEDEIGLVMSPGSFAIFFPSDLHRPCVCVGAPESIKKAVVKIDLALLGEFQRNQ
ncbi:YhcH/YjgK/YiaL family protein [Cohnella hongkongensis]|uniref:YhcH/YjgK/YiaL family protein n=1 Tax=Cohnella hongkongensis TaxID=178337 RepID=A0ABV9FGK6_9BACL